MVRRARRSELFEHEKRDLLDALGRCRAAIIKSQGALRYSSPTYAIGTAVIVAIDRLAERLTGDGAYFHMPPHSDLRQ